MENEGPGRAVRGRPRSERARAAVLDAASDLLVTGGIDAVTMEAIAARAKVSKGTLYKWWPSRAHVMLESFFSLTKSTIVVDEGASLQDVLTFQLASLSDLFRDTAAGPLMGDLVAAAQADPEIRAALDDEWLRPRRQVGARLLREAVERGELDPRIDVAAAVDQLFAPVYHRLLMGHEPLDGALAATLVRQLLDGVRSARPPTSGDGGDGDGDRDGVRGG
ncbi:TetR/AcrR family transcriptional regulator [Streptomyces sp. NPDC006638]|uniref:TetR/AcrR family transcriptional regulator n=1 Tax=unclassified Streptomyces TaxID=2593676 RepID=UPI0033A2BB69